MPKDLPGWWSPWPLFCSGGVLLAMNRSGKKQVAK